MIYSKQVQHSERIAAHSRNVHETQLKMQILLAIGHTPDLSEEQGKLEALTSQLQHCKKGGK
jgi:hypothetical protein